MGVGKLAYADYEYYRDLYGGVILSEADFERLAGRAQRILETDSEGRVLPYADKWFVKDCCCAVSEEIYACEKIREAGGVLKSEARGKVAVSYAVQGSGSEAKDERARVFDVECRYLGPWGIMYHGG